MIDNTIIVAPAAVVAVSGSLSPVVTAVALFAAIIVVVVVWCAAEGGS